MDSRFERRLRDTDPAFRELLGRLPLQFTPPLAPEWLRFEMLERHLVLGVALPGSFRAALEVGAGAHAIATVALAYRAGPNGRVAAVERRRWDHFRDVTLASGLADRIDPVSGDARRLPFRDDAVDWAVCVHGLRSLGDDRAVLEVLREMLRVSPRVMLAESLPIARTDAQAAHLEMYGLRQDVFLATTGRIDDVRYRTLEAIGALVERAGGTVEASRELDIDLPHALAYFPRETIERVPDPAERDRLVDRWDRANSTLQRSGEDHPPVGVVVGRRA